MDRVLRRDDEGSPAGDPGEHHQVGESQALPVAPRVLIKKLRADAVVPHYMTAHAAGLDLSAALDQPIEVAPGARAAIPTGLAIKLPDGYEAQVRPRSGLARDHGIT